MLLSPELYFMPYSFLLHRSQICCTCYSEKHAGNGLRFLISGVLWLCSFLIPVVVLQTNVMDPGFRVGIFVSIITMVSAIILFNLAMHAANKDRLRFSDKTWRSPIVRPTLPNIASLIHIIFAPFQLLLAFALLVATSEESKSEMDSDFFQRKAVETFLFLSTSKNIFSNENCRTQGIYVYDHHDIPTNWFYHCFVCRLGVDILSNSTTGDQR